MITKILNLKIMVDIKKNKWQKAKNKKNILQKLYL